MPTDTAGDVGKVYHTDQVMYLAKTFTFADDDVVKTVGILPPQAVVIEAGVVVTTAFSGGSPVVDIGTSGDPDAYGTALDMTTAGRIIDTAINANNDYSTSAQTIVVSLTSGSTITAGSGVCYVLYIMADR